MGLELSESVSVFVPFSTTEGLRGIAFDRLVEVEPRRGDVSLVLCGMTKLGDLNVSAHVSCANVVAGGFRVGGGGGGGGICARGGTANDDTDGGG